MKVFRLIKQKYSPDWTGTGAERIGRRWNSKGIPMIYTSESRALCTAEVAVHLSLASLERAYEIMTIQIPDNIIIFELLLEDLSTGWNSFPYNSKTQNIGDRFILQNIYVVMKVPSAVVPGDFNYLINPHHPDFVKIEIIKKEPYEFDQRLFKR